MAPRFDVIYDGDCGLCEASRRFGERLDWFGVFRWRPNQEEAVLKDHPHLTARALDGALHVTGEGRTLAGFDAVRFMLLRWPLAAWLGALCYLPGAAVPGRAAYRWVADHRRTVLACRIGEPTIVHKFFASAFICMVLAFALAGPILRIEDWPLTCAPMFATPLEADGARYSFRFVALDASGKERELASESSGVTELRLKRLLFGRYYGSVDPSYEYGGFPADTPAAFEKRMTGFFDEFVDGARKGRTLPRGIVEIQLVVIREAGTARERHVSGRYNVRDRKFRRSP
ncbi:MAG: DUF393 domain-containing protein [Planctomycetes bacterium]|nr:DUF393 domain-containing protein [Planctomycetota bacterium]